MSDDKLAFLDKPRDDKGRFAPTAQTPEPPPAPPVEAAPPPVQQEPAPQGAPPVAPAAAPAAQAPQPPREPPPPGHVPLEALLDTREKLKKFQSEAEEYRRKLEEATRRPEQVIDPIADPEAFSRALMTQRERDRQDNLFETSWLVAQQQHGETTVQAAEEWLASELQSNPGFFQTIARQRHPYDFVVKQHKIALRNAKLGDDDFETAARKWAEANGFAPQQQNQALPSAAAPTPQPGTPLPKPSLASAPSAGSNAPRIPLGGQAAFEAVFKS